MYPATQRGVKLAVTFMTLVVSNKFSKEYIAKVCLEIPSDVLLCG